MHWFDSKSGEGLHHHISHQQNKVPKHGTDVCVHLRKEFQVPLYKNISVCCYLPDGNATCASIAYHISYSSRSQPHKESAILSGSLWMLSILIQCNINPHSRFHTNAHVTLWPVLTKNAHFEVVHTWFDFILFFCWECSDTIRKGLRHMPAFYFSISHTRARTHTKTHQSAQHGTRWGSLKSQSHTCSPTHHVHIHTCTHVLTLILSLMSRGDFILNWQSQTEKISRIGKE